MFEPSIAQDEVAFDASTSGDGSDIIAFVGKKIFFQRNDPPGPSVTEEIVKSTGDETEDEIIIKIRNPRYESRFEILDLVEGNYAQEIIDFEAYFHVGTPLFSESENAFLVFVSDGMKNYNYIKYTTYEVHRTADGDWAACGDTWVQNDPEETEKEPLEKISFLEPVEVNIPSLMIQIEDQLEPDEIITDTERAEWQAELDEENAQIDGFYKAPIWKRDGNTATCLMGTRVKDLVKFQNQTRFLPEKRENICQKRYSKELDALGSDYKSKRAIMKDCTSLLKIQNLP